MSYESCILYHEGRTGKLFSWKVWTEGADIVTEYGPDDGKKQVVRKIAKGKNIGKKNETTPEEQADKEALAMWQHKLDRKYRKTKAKAKETVFLPMLAHDYIKKYLKRNKSLEYPVDVQPKLDGVRCMAYWEDGELKLLSRGGKQWDVAHIQEEIASFLPPGSVLDGELYIHGKSLQQITHLVKDNSDPEHKDLEFRVFDGFHTECTHHMWDRRRDDLVNLFNKREVMDVQKVFPVTTYKCKTEKQLFEFLKDFEKSGFEGIIVRILSGKYELGHRSSQLLKLKNFMDGEFEVVGYHHGSGRDEKCVVWDCVTPEGIEFGVRPMGTIAEREQMLIDAEQYIGRMLTVKYQQPTDDNVPQFPVGVAFRDEGDL